MTIELLKRCPLFAGLKEEDLQKIRSIAFLKKAGKKEVLFCDGEEARGFYVILSGKVKVYKVSPEGKEQILHVISAPDAFASALRNTRLAEAPTVSFFSKRDFILRSIITPAQHYYTVTLPIQRFALPLMSFLKEVSRMAKYLLDLSIWHQR
jgi:CRP/FNR family transcriptional regulator